MNLDLICCLCTKEVEIEVDTPEGWDCDFAYGQIVFCPDHAIIADFKNKQCSGCLEFWGECDLWQSFQYSEEKCHISDLDFDWISMGHCPRRKNATWELEVKNGIPISRLQQINISEKAPEESGRAFVKAIKDYMKRNFEEEKEGK